MYPSTGHTVVQNAARMSVFANAAYLTGVSDQQRFANTFPDSDVHWWRHANASGVACKLDQSWFIGIAGTNDREDMSNNVNLERTTGSQWSDATAIAIHKTAKDTSSTAGFWNYTTNCFHGITGEVQDESVVWIAGHSLGGAAAMLLQLTFRFGGARTYTYGAPRVFFPSPVPARLRYRVVRPLDPITFLPRACSHALCESVYITRKGHAAHSLPWYHRPLAACYQLATYTPWAFSKGHAMARYEADLCTLK